MKRRIDVNNAKYIGFMVYEWMLVINSVKTQIIHTYLWKAEQLYVTAWIFWFCLSWKHELAGRSLGSVMNKRKPTLVLVSLQFNEGLSSAVWCFRDAPDGNTFRRGAMEGFLRELSGRLKVTWGHEVRDGEPPGPVDTMEIFTWVK